MTYNLKCNISSVNLTINLIKMKKRITEILENSVNFDSNSDEVIYAAPNDIKYLVNEILKAINFTDSSSQLKKSIQQDFERWYLSEGYTPTEKIGVYKNGCNITLHAHLFYKYVNDVKF